MTPFWGSCLTTFIAGFAIGYGVRALISLRRRAEARRRYQATGSSRRVAKASAGRVFELGSCCGFHVANRIADCRPN